MTEKDPGPGGVPGTKDAIHVATFVGIADEYILPGQKVRFSRPDDTTYFKGGCPSEYVGILNPFSGWSVEKGQPMAVWLTPGSTTSLKHEWESPQFQSQAPVDDDHQWLLGFGATIGAWEEDEELGSVVQQLEHAAEGAVESGVGWFGFTGYQEHLYDEPLWDRFWRIMKKRHPSWDIKSEWVTSPPFRCSC